MQIELLDTFLDLIETRSFHRSAERLRITQSTVSARVQVLEAAVGARLFSRSRAGTNLTTEGLKFETHARSLRHAWAEAQRAVAPSGDAAVTLRIGIQHDLAAGQADAWARAFRKALPECAFYLEPDYSAQMCKDIERGALDFALIYTPHPTPDLHFVSIGEVSYQLITSGKPSRADLGVQSYIRGSYSLAFDAVHRQILPMMTEAPLASGQNGAVADLLTGLGGAAFVMDTTAHAMIATERFRPVDDVDPITQPVYAAMHLRHRPSRMHGRLTRIVSRKLRGRISPALPQPGQ